MDRLAYACGVAGGGDLAQCYFMHHKSHMEWPGIEPGTMVNTKINPHGV